MLRANKESSHTILKMSCYLNGETVHEFLLDKSKMMVGSFEAADIYIPNNHISHYHAMIFMNENGGGKIVDLESENGVKINSNDKLAEGVFYSGDIIKLGPFDFHILEHISVQHIVDQDEKQIIKLEEEQEDEWSPEKVPIEGLTLIDGEYCDITFPDDNYTPSEEIPVIDNLIDFSSYVDTTDENATFAEIAKKTDKKSIEVSVMSRGNILSVDYFNAAGGKYYLSSRKNSSNTTLLCTLGSKKNVPFITIKKGTIYLHNIPDFVSCNLALEIGDPFKNKETIKFDNNDIISFYHGTTQVLVRMVDAPPELSFAPFFGSDRIYMKHMAKVVAAMMSIMLLLLFVDIESIKPPTKKIAIIYKRAVKAKNDIKAKKLGNESDKKDKKIAKAKKSPEKATKKKAKLEKVVKKQVSPPAPKTKPKPAKIKAYEFKMNKSLSSLFGSTKSLRAVKLNKSSDMPDAGFAPNKASNLKSLKSSSNISVGTLGDDSKGRYDRSYGAKGLVSKHGIDTTYIDPKTVILGSMDPELLRKILREYLPQFKHCYQQELQRNSDNLKGVIDLNFQIGKTGRVTRVSIKAKNSKFSKKGINCMAGVLKIIKFPKPKGGGVVDVRQPLNFFAEKTKID